MYVSCTILIPNACRNRRSRAFTTDRVIFGRGYTQGRPYQNWYDEQLVQALRQDKHEKDDVLKCTMYNKWFFPGGGEEEKAQAERETKKIKRVKEPVGHKEAFDSSISMQ